jgi:mannose-6-phosphate isomerase class I
VSYDPFPTYPVVGGEVETAWPQPPRDAVVAIDGPPAVSWDELPFDGLDMRDLYAPWEEVERRTASFELRGDPVFGRLFEGELRDFFVQLPERGPSVVYGPGAALVPHDVLWYADVPKRQALAGRAPNLGRRKGPGSERRLLFVDWPVLDRHKRRVLPSLDRYVDLADPARPRSLSGDTLRGSLRALAKRPFRVRPTFLPGPWGGRWLLDELGVEEDVPNLAWSYELITPQSGVLLDGLEAGFELLLAAAGRDVLGAEAEERFGSSFPIRFDYLDTLGGGHLSIQCHPTDSYAREVFGLPYTQHESYYVMTTEPGATVFHGLREDADVGAFRADAEAAARAGTPFDPARYLRAHPSEPHQLYLIPGGTPHASGAGNVVLEISATPYLYTLRFYDWLRRDLDGELRPVHIEHAFANLDGRGASGPVGAPSVLRAGDGWAELVLGRDPEIFFAVHRLDFEREAEDDTNGRFHVLNLVEGDVVEVGGHPLAYAETLVVPAAVGRYTLRGGPAKVVKAFVP